MYNRDLYKRDATTVYLIEGIADPNFIASQVFAELDEMKCAYNRRERKKNKWVAVFLRRD